jgi:hypothetical protein
LFLPEFPSLFRAARGVPRGISSLASDADALQFY